jgi:hypothetical protein
VNCTDDMDGASSRHMRNAYKMLVVNMKGRHHLRDLGIDGRVKLKSMLKKQDVRLWTGVVWSRTVPYMVLHLWVSQNGGNILTS